MGLVLLGSRNLADDQADQKPSVVARKKDDGSIKAQPWIEIVEIGTFDRKAIFHYFTVWPEDEWSAIKEEEGEAGHYIREVDMSQCMMKTIGDEAFNTLGLRKVVLPPRLETIGAKAFESSGFSSDSVTPTLPKTLKEIGATAFASCSYWKFETLPDNVESIGDQAFSVSGIIISKLPAKLKTIGDYAFANTDVTIDKIPESVEYVGKQAFNHCKGITKIEIGAKEIDERAFGQCTNIKKAWVRSSCETIHASTTTTGLFPYVFNVDIWAEPSAKPNGWDTYYNYIGNGTAKTVTYGQTTSPF